MTAAPGLAPSRLGLASQHLAQGRLAEALAEADLALADARAHGSAVWGPQLLRGLALARLGRCDESAAALTHPATAAEAPVAAQTEALRCLADLCLNTFGDPHAAAAVLARLNGGGQSLEGGLAQAVCAQYDGSLDAQALSAAMRALARQLPVPALPRAASRPRTARRPARRAVRIGLISNQWCASPVGFLVLGTLRELARHADLHLFDRGGKADWAHAEFQALAGTWHGVRSVATAPLAQTLRDADLDALIDLSGWTDPQALAAVAARPAPRQFKWVGGQSVTTGLNCFDGWAADAHQVPAPCAALHSEPILHLEPGYVSYVSPPYAPDLDAAATCPSPPAQARWQGELAVVSNPAKLSAATARHIEGLKPRRLILIDHRWRHEQTRQAARRRLGSLMDVAEFVTPANHPEYLDALRHLQAPVLDTAPYSMGLTAIELRLLGKPVLQVPRPRLATMRELHCVAHLAAPRFNHHAELAQQWLAWCSGRVPQAVGLS